jgi:hypothetical protein
MTRNPDEWFRQRPRWASPTKLQEYYADYLFPDKHDDPQHEVYKAVLSGAVRVRHEGRILSCEEVAAICKKQWSYAEGDYYALPADIGLSVVDALRVWADRPGASAMLESFGPE